MVCACILHCFFLSFLLLSLTQPIPERFARRTRVLGFAQKVQTRQTKHGDKDVHKNLAGEPHSEKGQVVDLNIEDLVDRRVPGVIRKGLGGELDNGHGAHQNESGVEQEGTHVGLAENHRMQLDAGDPQSKLETSRHGRQQQIQRKDGDAQKAKEAEKPVEESKVRVQKGRDGFGIRKDVDTNVDDPNQRNDDAADPKKETEVGLEGVVVFVVVCTRPKVVDVLLQ